MESFRPVSFVSGRNVGGVDSRVIILNRTWRDLYLENTKYGFKVEDSV